MAFGNMMNGMGGIGQRAADLRDSNTPQQLQQSYQKSAQEGKPDIATLLALNDVMKQVKEKEAEMRLAMKPEEPGTVLEQRAKELKDLTVGQNTSEKAEQVGGIAQLQQQKQQQNMQSMAQGTQGPPQGPQMAPQAPPRMAANGGIIMQGAPNMQRMAGGGIIGFASRGEVKAADMAQFEDDFGPAPVSAVISQAEIDAHRANLPPHRQPIDVTSDAEIVRQIRNPVSLFPKGRAGPPMLDRAARAERDYQVSETERKAGAGFDRMLATHRAGLPTLPANVNNFGSPPAVTTGGPSAVTTGGLPAVTTGGPLTLSNQPITQGPGPARIARKEVPPVRLPLTGIGANTAEFSGRQGKLDERQAAYDEENRDRIAALTNPVDAGIAASTRAEKFIGRDRNATQRAAMLQRRKEANEAAAALRSKNSFADLTSTAGGVGGLANLGRGAANIRRQDAAQKRKELLGELTAEEKNIVSDEATARGISKDSLAVQNTTTTSNAQLTAQVMKARQQSITDQGRNLNAAEQRALAARVANMTAAQKQQELASNEYINRLDNASKEKISAARNKIMSTTNDLAREANSLKGQKDRNDLKAKYAIAIANVKKTKEKLVADMVTARSVELMGKKATPASKKLIMAQVRKDVDSSLNAAIKALQDELSRLNLKVVPTGKPTNGKQ